MAAVPPERAASRSIMTASGARSWMMTGTLPTHMWSAGSLGMHPLLTHRAVLSLARRVHQFESGWTTWLALVPRPGWTRAHSAVGVCRRRTRTLRMRASYVLASHHHCRRLGHHHRPHQLLHRRHHVRLLRRLRTSPRFCHRTSAIQAARNRSRPLRSSPTHGVRSGTSMEPTTRLRLSSVTTTRLNPWLLTAPSRKHSGTDSRAPLAQPCLSRRPAGGSAARTIQDG